MNIRTRLFYTNETSTSLAHLLRQAANKIEDGEIYSGKNDIHGYRLLDLPLPIAAVETLSHTGPLWVAGSPAGQAVIIRLANTDPRYLHMLNNEDTTGSRVT